MRSTPDIGIRTWTLPLTSALILTGCVSAARQADRHFVAGEYAEAATAYQQYLEGQPTGASRARAMYRLAIMRASPDSPVYDPGAARALLEALLAQAADGPYAGEARLVLALQERLASLTTGVAEREARIERLSAEVAALAARIERLAADASERDKELTAVASQLAARTRETRQLRQEIGSRDEEIKRLGTALEQLKAIDLRRRR